MIKKGMKVKVLTGKDKSKEGEVIAFALDKINDEIITNKKVNFKKIFTVSL